MRRWLLLAVLAVVGCADPIPRTQVMVAIDADEDVRAAARSLRVVVEGGPTPGDLVTGRAVTFDASWPTIVGVVPRNGDARRTFAVRAEALDGSGGRIAVAVVIGRFVARRTMSFRLVLYGGCGTRCGLDETCNAEGGCDPAMIQADDLVPWTGAPDAGPRDAGREDASPMDGGRDDAGRRDAGRTDGGPPDAGESDAGPPRCGQRVIDVAVGANFTCAVTDVGGLWCWGYNNVGQTGRTAGGLHTRPEIISEDEWSAVAAGFAHACAIKRGELHCWGANDVGQAGLGAAGPPAEGPTPVGTSSAWTAIDLGGSTGGGHSCGLQGTALYCWGWNSSGMVGDGSTTDRVLPTAITTPGAWARLALGHIHTCGTSPAGTLYCWGSDAEGQLGLTGGVGTARPQMHSTTGWSRIASGQRHTCGVQDGMLFCWGSNAVGQLGLEEMDGAFHGAPQAVHTRWPPGSAITDVAAGNDNTCAVVDGALWCWGSNERGRIGLPMATARIPTPTRVPAPVTVARVVANTDHTCVLGVAGHLYCTGSDMYGELGRGAVMTNSFGFVEVCIP